MATKGSVSLKLTIYFVNICLAIFDKFSHILYYFGQSINASYLRGLILFFLLASPIVQIISWAIILGQISLGEKFSDNIKVKNAKTQMQYYKLMLSEGFFFIIRLGCNTLKQIPLSFCVTFLQELKMFPFALFGYSYFKYKAIITTTIMNNIAPLIEEKRKQLLEKKEKEMNLTQNLEKIQQTRRRGLNQINNFQEAMLQNERNLQGQSTVAGFLQSPQASQLDMSGSHKKSLQQSLLNHSNGIPKQSKFGQKPSINQSPQERATDGVQLQFQKTLKLSKNSSQDQSKQGGSVEEHSNQNVQHNNIRLPINEINKHAEKLYESHIEMTGENYDSKKSNQGIINNDDEDEDGMSNDDDDDLESQNSNSVYINNLNNQIAQKKTGFARVVQIMQQQKADVTGRNSQFGFANQKNALKKLGSEQNKGNEQKASHSLDLLLDANSKPTIEMLVFDKNLTKFLQITNVIQTFFEALPLSILQYINNEIGGLWFDKHGNYNYFVILSFFSSCLMIFQFGIQLIQLLYGKNISVFYQTMQYLNNHEMQQDQKGIPSASYNLGSLFPMPQTVNIVKLNQLEKINNLSQNAFDKVTNLTISLPDHAVYFEYIMSETKRLMNKIKNLEQIHLNFRNNRIKDVSKILDIVSQTFTNRNLSTFSLKLQDNLYNLLGSNQILAKFQLWEYNKIKKESIKINKIIIDDYQTIVGIKNESVLLEKYSMYKELLNIPKNQQKKQRFYYQSSSEQVNLKTFVNSLFYINDFLTSLKSVQIILFQVLGDSAKLEKPLSQFKKMTALSQYIFGTEDNGILGYYGFNLNMENNKVSFTKLDFDLHLDSQILLLHHGLTKHNQKNGIEQLSLNYSPPILNGQIPDDAFKNDIILSRGLDIITKYTKITTLDLNLKDCILQQRFLMSMKEIFPFLPKLQYFTIDFSTSQIEQRILQTFLNELQLYSNRFIKFSIDLSGGIPLELFSGNTSMITSTANLTSLEISLWENSRNQNEQQQQPLMHLFEGDLNNPQKIKLSLRKNGLSDDHLEMIMKKLKHSDKIQELYLDYQNNNIVGNGLKLISTDLQQMFNLVQLTINLHNNKVGDFLCKEILEGILKLSNCTKMEFDFGYNEITDVAAIEWANKFLQLYCTDYFFLNFEQNIGKINILD